MAKVFVEDNQLKISLGFWEHVGGFSGDLSFHVNNIVSAHAADKLDLNSLGMRLGGTGLPGLAVLGHFRKRGVKIFCNWAKGQRVLSIELRNSKFQRLELGCMNPEELLLHLNIQPS
jgi:hypothetical protein